MHDGIDAAIPALTLQHLRLVSADAGKEISVGGGATIFRYTDPWALVRKYSYKVRDCGRTLCRERRLRCRAVIVLIAVIRRLQSSFKASR